MSGKLSIKELNKVLPKLPGSNLEFLGTFSEVDIAFVAGLFLRYKQYEKEWKKIPRFFDIDLTSDNKFNHSHYFEQIEFLYEVKYNQIFERFPFVPNSAANPFSQYFAPPIYITNENIDYFFEKSKKGNNIWELKNTYINNFGINELTKEIYSSEYNTNEHDFLNYIKDLKERLHSDSAIFTFVFLVSYYKISENERKEEDKNKKSKAKRTFKEFVNNIEKTWYFTQEYVRGLHELANNIVEHSGKDEQKGEGMITIRAYSKNKTDKTKILETHVFDYGDIGIIPKLREYTENKSKDDNIKTSVKGCYKADLEKLNPTFTLTDFIKPEKKPLEQQMFRHIGHYGINKLQKLVEGEPLGGDMYIESLSINGKREYYGDQTEENTIKIGTSYFFEIPFIAGNFRKISLPELKKTQTSTFGTPDGLTNLLQKKIKHISHKELHSIEESFNGILDITINEKITKDNFDEIIDHLFQLSKSPKNEMIVAINLENGIAGESNLLRFLGYLSFEYKERSFVIYNLDYDVFNKMIEDNKAFAKSRRWQSFWNEDKNNGMLVFTKHFFKTKDGSEKKFYFADILHGATIENYNHVNRALSNTFPNSAAIVDKDVRNTNTGDVNQLKSFFFQNTLLPYDVLLKKENKPLFLHNIKTILQNRLIGRTLSDYYSPTEVIENYIEHFDGYCISNTHFKIGNKIHSSDFYYAKRLFQNSFYTARLAIHLAKKISSNIVDASIETAEIVSTEINSIFSLDNSITDLSKAINSGIARMANDLADKEKKNNLLKAVTIISNEAEVINKIYEDAKIYTKWDNKETTIFKEVTTETYLPNEISDIVKQAFIKEPITLVGYEMYSELLLSLTKKILKEIYKFNVNHFVAQSGSDKLFFLPEDTFKTYLREYNNGKTIIVVPIAATGSTANKIENEIKKQIGKNEKSKQETKELIDNYSFLGVCHNIILAQDDKFNTIAKNDKLNPPIIDLIAKWYEIKNCSLCYGVDTKPLFDTDKSSLTPSLIFGNPKGLTRSKHGKEIDSIIEFDQLKFDQSIKYQRIFRNDNYRIYDVDSDAFINNAENKKNIIQWLKKIVKPHLDENAKKKIIDYIKDKIEKTNKRERDYFFKNYKREKENDTLEEDWFEKFVDLYKKDKTNAYKEWLQQLNKNYNLISSTPKIKPTDKIVIVAPCHESNSQFLNLINEHVFSSAATIIHHQNGVDFAENFQLLNENYLIGEHTKVFYVDDSLITGKHFFELFDLVRGVTKNPFTASILLNDQAIPFTHDRVVRWSNNYFAFATYNQPPTLNILEKRPLEHEQKRYEQMVVWSLHDTLMAEFQKKANKLNPKKPNKEKETPEKRFRRLKMFEATHKIYKYFAEDENRKMPDVIDDIVNFRPIAIEGISLHEDEEKDVNSKALLKVLSQYPFILYENIKKETFKWHKSLLDKAPEGDGQIFNIDKDYSEFTTFKFLLRRAAFLGNYQVLEKEFLEKLLSWFVKIDKYLENSSKGTSDKEKNLRDFPIFVLGNYAEMIQKNGWVAHRILKIELPKDENFLSQLKDSNQGKQFLCMLQLEAASAINDFVLMIEKEHRIDWRDMFRYEDNEEQKPENQRKFNTEINTQTNRILDFFRRKPELKETNKFLNIRDTFFNNDENLDKPNSQFVNFLWVKQLLYADCKDKESHFPKGIGYQAKINEIIKKMKDFFPFSVSKNVRTFFIVTDGQQNPHVLSQDNHLLNVFAHEFGTDKQLKYLDDDIKELEKRNDNLDAEEKVELEKKKESKRKLEEEKENHNTQTIIDFLNGENTITGNASETTAEFYFENGTWKNIYINKSKNLKFMPSESKWLYLIRISELKENGSKKDNNFETQGLFGFYSTDDLRESILPKQLLMLLRKDMSEFIKKHHKNDGFAELIKEKERADYQFLMKHGVSDYTNAINNNLTKTTGQHRDNCLKILFEYLINKFNIISKLSTQAREYEDIAFRQIVEEFNKYPFVFTFFAAGKASYSLEEVNNLICFESKSDCKSNVFYKFPKDYLRDLVFELLYNIRNHIIIPNKGDITETDKLEIKVYIENQNLCIENNHCTAEPTCYTIDKSHGLDLLEKIWQSYGLGYTSYGKTKNDTFKVIIPLSIIKNEKEDSNNN